MIRIPAEGAGQMRIMIRIPAEGAGQMRIMIRFPAEGADETGGGPGFAGMRRRGSGGRRRLGVAEDDGIGVGRHVAGRLEDPLVG